VLLDELHAWTELHRAFYGTITTGSGARRQPLFVTATTAGDDKSLIWQEEHNHAVRVATGEIIDDRLLSFVAELDEKDDPFDEALWEKSNPNLGISITLEYLRQQAAEAANKPTFRNQFIRYHGNRRVSSVEHCFAADEWAKLAGTMSDWKTADAIGIGIDLGGRDDLAAWGACARWPLGEDAEGKPLYRYEIFARAYLVSQTRRNTAQQPWARWLWEGHLKQAEHVIEAIRQDVIAFSLEHAADGIAFDPHNARQLGDELQAEGCNPFSFPQTCALYHEPLKTFIVAAQSGHVRHDGGEMLAWAAANLAIHRNHRDEWMPDKKSSRDKIDPIVAVIMAFRVCYFARPRAVGCLFTGA